MEASEQSNKRRRNGLLAASRPQVLRFSDGFSNNDFRLLKLPKALISQLKSQPNASEKRLLRFVGQAGTEAVLCTDSETYSVVRVETSNDVFLVPPSSSASSSSFSNEGEGEGEGEKQEEFEVTARCKYYYELKRCKPSIKVLKDFLQGTEYSGGSSAESCPRNPVTYAQLESGVQMSRQEMEILLKKLHVVTVDGCLRILDPHTLHSAIDVILSTIVAKDWDVKQVDLEACLEECPSVNRIVVQEALNALSATCAQGSTFTLDIEKIARASAHLVFSSAGDESKRWHPEEFLALWNVRLPNGISGDPALLKGIALKETSATKETWMYFPRSRLSKEEDVRFQELFHRRARWELEDLEAYMKDLASDEAEQAKLLLAHTRSITDIESSRRYIVAK